MHRRDYIPTPHFLKTFADALHSMRLHVAAYLTIHGILVINEEHFMAAAGYSSKLKSLRRILKLKQARNLASGLDTEQDKQTGQLQTGHFRKKGQLQTGQDNYIPDSNSADRQDGTDRTV